LLVDRVATPDVSAARSADPHAPTAPASNTRATASRPAPAQTRGHCARCPPSASQIQHLGSSIVGCRHANLLRHKDRLRRGLKKDGVHRTLTCHQQRGDGQRSPRGDACIGPSRRPPSACAGSPIRIDTDRDSPDCPSRDRTMSIGRPSRIRCRSGTARGECA
jgi:hypothetical protein